MPRNTALERANLSLGEAGGRKPINVAPSSFDQVKEFASMLAESGMIPKDYRDKPGDIVAAIIMGAEVGLQPMAALQSIAVINGRPALWGDGLLAVCSAHPSFDDIDERLEKSADRGLLATCVVKRRGRTPTRRQFSQAQAKQAGLWGRNVWGPYPERMLQMRARGLALRDAFADVLRGLSVAEEQQDIEIAAARNVTPVESDQPAIDTDDNDPPPDPDPPPSPVAETQDDSDSTPPSPDDAPADITSEQAQAKLIKQRLRDLHEVIVAQSLDFGEALQACGEPVGITTYPALRDCEDPATLAKLEAMLRRYVGEPEGEDAA